VALLLAILFGFLSPLLASDETTISANVNARKIGVEDQLQLEVTLRGKSVGAMDEIAPPPLKNLRVVGGPFVSTQISLVNGAMSQSKSYTYVLQGVGVGSAEIGAIKARISGGGEKATAPIAIDVVAGSVLPKARREADPFGGDPFESFFGRRPRQQRAEAKLFVEQSVSRSKVFVGEPILLTYFLYTQTSVTGIQFGESPKLAGFWSEDLEKAKELPEGEPATVDGESYRKFPIYRKLIFPTKAGRLTIPGTKLKMGLPRHGGFLFGDAGSELVERESRGVTVEVLPVPEDSAFSGAVGRFRISATVDKPSLALGEAATLRFEVEGSGNLKWVEKGPEVRVNGAKVYPPQVKSDLRTTAAGISGSRTWEFVVVPETVGNLEVPALSFSWFDPGAGRIERGESRPIPLAVAGGTGAAAVLPGGTDGRSSPRGISPLPLRSELDLPTRAVPFLSPVAVGGLLGVVLLVHLLVWGVPMLRSRLAGGRRSDRGGSRRNLRGSLADLSKAAKGGMTKEAAAALIEKAIVGVFGEVDEGPVESGGEAESAARELLQEVKFIRYAPQLGDYGDKIREVARRAEELIRRWG
jgi:hypothetical protein